MSGEIDSVRSRRNLRHLIEVFDWLESPSVAESCHWAEQAPEQGERKDLSQSVERGVNVEAFP
jgi:hypothetical protein